MFCSRRGAAGELGPGVIVGSAAFTLLGISAVCVSGLKGEETRKVKQMGGFATTAAFSVFAYVWLLIILGVNGKGPSSPDVVEPWEGALKLRTVRMARDWLALPHPAGEAATARDMRAIVDAWPGEICAEGWDSWRG